MLDPLATLDDLDGRLKGGLSDDEEPRAEVLLDDASREVRKVTGQQFTVATSTLALFKIRGGIIRLTQRPVTAVSAVEDMYGNDLTFLWLSDDRVQLSTNPLNSWELEPYRTPLGEVKVTYTHGYEEIPSDVVAIVCNMVGRALGRDERDGGLTQESIEGYAYTIGAIGAAGVVGLLPEEQRSLAYYARVGGSILTS